MSEIAITWSAADSFSHCPRKYFWSYVKQLTGDPQNKYLMRGTDIHRLLEIWYKSKDMDAVREALTLTNYRDLDYFERFVVWYAENFADQIEAFTGLVETELCVRLPGTENVVLRGKSDLYMPDTETVVDHKTTGKANGKHWTRQVSSGQLHTYAFGLMSMGWPVSAGRLNVLCWTEKDRSWRRYCPEVPISKETVVPWVRYLRDVAEAIQEAEETDEYPAMKNNLCFWCEFRTPCQEMGADQTWSEEAMCQYWLRRKTRAHEELGENPLTPADPAVEL